jgi:hypothetical protein
MAKSSLHSTYPPSRPGRAGMVPTRARRHAASKAAQGGGEVKLAVMLPEALAIEVHTAAAQQRKTLRAVVLEALRAAGYGVTDEMIADRRVEANRRRGSR